VNHPTPAIVSQAAVRRLPRAALLLFCLAYLLPGFLGRDAWRSADITTLGFMAELATGSSDWLRPTLMGVAPDNPALLPYWLGAWMYQTGASAGLGPLLARAPFALMLLLAMTCTWYGTYYLARSPGAQPVAFAFGGEAQPKDYARTMADGGLLALIACLGLAQLGHETTPALVQLGCTSLLFFALASLHFHKYLALLCAGLGALGLGLSGAPTLALLLLAGGTVLHLLGAPDDPDNPQHDRQPWSSAATLLALALLTAAVCWQLSLWRWKVELPPATWAELNGTLQLLTWFTWPAWPLACWTLWRWRGHLLRPHSNRHIALPLWFVGVSLTSTLTTGSPDRSLLLGLPACAALAAFALPTLSRQVAALIDWFTLLFFSGCGIVIWVVWLAMQTGIPSQPAANVARLAPGFEPTFSALACTLALAATLVWGWLVRWRVGRHRAAIWKSLVLPAGGAALCWLLLMTLWMPLLNYTQSYQVLVRHTLDRLPAGACVETLGLGQAKVAAYQVYGGLALRPMQAQAQCPSLLSEPADDMQPPRWVDATQWELTASVRHPADANETVLLYRRRAAAH